MYDCHLLTYHQIHAYRSFSFVSNRTWFCILVVDRNRHRTAPCAALLCQVKGGVDTSPQLSLASVSPLFQHALAHNHANALYHTTAYLTRYVNDIGGGPADGFYVEATEQQHKGARPRTQGDEFYASVGAENGVYSPGMSSGVGGRANTINSMSNYDNAAGAGITAAEGAVHDARYEAYGNEDEDGGAGGYGNAAEIGPHTAAAEAGRYYERVGAPENEYSNMEMEMELGNSYATPYAQQQQQESQQFDHYAQPQQYLQQQQGPPSQSAHADRSSYAVFNSGGSPSPATAQQLPEAWTPAAWNASAHLSML